MINAKIPKFKSLVPLKETEINHLLWPPKFSSLPLALQHYINSDTPIHGQKIHSYIFKTGYKPNTNICIKLIILHLKSSCLFYARQLFDEMRQPTLSAYNYMISGYVKHGFVLESFDMVKKLCLSGETPDAYTLSMILKGSTSSYAESYSPYIGKQVHAQIFKCVIEGDDVLYTALVDSYVKSGRVDYARRVFDLMLEKDVVCSTSLITGYMNQCYIEDAEDVFSRTTEKDVVVFNAMIEGYSKQVENAKKAIEVYIDMQRLGFRPNISTFASIIGACSALAEFEIGQQVQGQLMKTELIEHVKIGSALIDMYSKCGLVEDARRVFNYMPEKNVFSWTSMIDGYGKNGYPNEALELFSVMQIDHLIVPNYVTFLSALSACAHSGLVAKGREIFESMERDYSMKPRMEHYACMVDILGRSGSLNQALEFVINMTERPDSDVWAALLSSCRLHGDVELANLAANELFKLSSGSRPGAYVALSNALADAGRWDGVSELREIMKIRGISKGTGFSWVGGDSSLKAFFAEQHI
ncbi:pentatricopeptide repeat-containing protein At1g28690, mitochondrial [Nicotiana tomentosiformis]|uniref:Pentatricopeptide repeat-containing protein At1g28690, mitochondrial-like n=1 Tax=Nicotiana tabacum TaxID=4097 RepID=A0A1S4CMK7_TOBAC|nr:PREDICTED: pentatricopeptide repeat-containing protein At1g28690, mitochondrial-like [Nicotiana tabacum]XP_033515108.1 pentatricopeptide repeat-containing protein At1g28690, mitochondrial [Nicotiana tomentosiformis]